MSPQNLHQDHIDQEDPKPDFGDKGFHYIVPTSYFDELPAKVSARVVKTSQNKALSVRDTLMELVRKPLVYGAVLGALLLGAILFNFKKDNINVPIAQVATQSVDYNDLESLDEMALAELSTEDLLEALSENLTDDTLPKSNINNIGSPRKGTTRPSRVSPKPATSVADEEWLLDQLEETDLYDAL